MSIFIIAEIGINHNGNIEIAKKLIDIAIQSGCNAVKFQKRTIDLVYDKETLDMPRESPWGSTQRDQKNGLEFTHEDYLEINEYCNMNNTDWFASAWDIESQKFLRQFNCKYNKVASAMIVYEDLLELIASEGKHTFISTGMSTFQDIDKAVEIFTKHNCSYELMHTNSTYPSKPEAVNLNCIHTLRKKYNCNIGYSGHESGIAISLAATGFGITSLERHITLDKTMYGSDQAASLEPGGLRSLVDSVRKIEISMGNGDKVFLKEEFEVAKKLRAHLNWKS